MMSDYLGPGDIRLTIERPGLKMTIIGTLADIKILWPETKKWMEMKL